MNLKNAPTGVKLSKKPQWTLYMRQKTFIKNKVWTKDFPVRPIVSFVKRCIFAVYPGALSLPSTTVLIFKAAKRPECFVHSRVRY